MADLPDRHHLALVTSLRAGVTSTFNLSEHRHHAESALAGTVLGVQQNGSIGFRRRPEAADLNITAQHLLRGSPAGKTKRPIISILYICPPCPFRSHFTRTH